MPCFHFNIDDGKAQPAFEAVELESLAVAKCEAVKLAGRIICESADQFWERAEWDMVVTDEGGMTLFELHFMGMEAPAARMEPLPRPTPG